jgi:hypothetical protein
MNTVLQIVLGVFRQAWSALAVLMVSAAALGMLLHVLQALGASALGARTWAAESLAALASLFLLLLAAFLGIPPVVRAVSAALPAAPGCAGLPAVAEPLAELGLAASGLVTAIVSLRMLAAFARAIGSVAAGGPAGISGAVLEAIEALIGMLLMAVVVPLVTAFFGFCG